MIFHILQINLPQSISKRYWHSMSVFTVGLNCVWIVVTGGCVELHTETIDGGVQYSSTLVSQPNINMTLELSKYMYQFYYVTLNNIIQ